MTHGKSTAERSFINHPSALKGNVFPPKKSQIVTSDQIQTDSIIHFTLWQVLFVKLKTSPAVI